MQRRAHKKWKRRVIALAVVCLLAAGGWWLFARPTTTSVEQTSIGALVWPSFGQAAVGIVGTSTLETHGKQTPVPTASTAKLITALTVLKKYPLQPGQTGPLLTMSASDIKLMNYYAARDGSMISKVLIGEKLSEYQMLEAMMLPSANNMADSLAIWAYGSLPAYRKAANSYLTSLGLNDTHVGTDASGLDPSTVSTAHDMVIIGEHVMQNPVLAQIVAQPSVSDFPLVGTITNTNSLLGQSGIVGIKTGNSNQQGGAFVSATKIIVNGQTKTVITAVLGAPSLDGVMSASLTLSKSVKPNSKRVESDGVNSNSTEPPTTGTRPPRSTHARQF